MDIIIQSLGFKAGEQLESFVREKLSNLKSDDIVRAQVTMYKGADSDPENDYCEIRLEVPGNDHFVKRQSPYFETSVSECVDLLSQMIKKTKEKQIDRRQAEAITIQDAMLDAASDDTEPDLEDVVK